MLSWNNSENPIWIYPKQDVVFKESIIKEFKLHPVIAQILVNRGFKTLEEIHDFLYAKLPDLHDPFLMAEMPQAVERVCLALKENENILIYGDNDVDGMTGTALLTEFLQFIGANVFFYVSTRTAPRQRLIVEALEYALKNNCKLLITVDCGITAAEEIAQVVKHGVDVIVTDHHEPTDTIPHCAATLNPKLLNNSYPNRELTGVGVAFKLAHGIINQLVSENKISPKKVDLKRYLDLVALGTISDMGALVGENRILVRYGIRQLRKTKRIGLLKLMSVSDVDLNELSAFDIASKIAPRLNSLGRIDDPQKGVKMLLVRNVIMAEKMAIELDLNNIERQKIERMMSTEAENMISSQAEILKHKAIILQSEKWHPGIIAILSARISRHYNKPVITIAIENGIGKGSLRSIPEFPLLPHLKECSDILMNYGGHDFAAGLMIKESNIEEFKTRFICAADAALSENDVMTKLFLDSEVHFDDLTFDFMESIRLLEPFGNGNYPPILYCSAKQAWPPKVVGKTHLKFYLLEYFRSQGRTGERMLEGIAFGRASDSSSLRKRNLSLEIAFTPQVNNFQGPSIQLMIRDFNPLVND
ncbi:MAG: single-stranded-DNA-specific exonuclease RecJ [Parachlamydiaceae bacterium]